MMRVSVVATGIDAVAKSDAMPLPAPRRRAGGRPGRARGRAAAAPGAAGTSRARWPSRPREPSFADHRVAAEDEREALFAEPEAAAVPQPGGLQRTAPFGQPKFEGDGERRAGEPSPDALRRLQAAVQNVPKAQPMVRPIAPPAREPERHSRLTINSLIHKMTGQVGREQAPRRSRAEPSRRAQPDASADYEETERERVDIPAFLRRQAN